MTEDEEFQRMLRWLGAHNEDKSTTEEGLTVEQTKQFEQGGRWLLGYFIVVGLVLAFAAFGANAQAACPWDASCISWIAPTQYTDGSTLPAASIASYKVEAAPNAAGPWMLIATVPAPATSYQRRPVSGTNFYRVSVVLVSGIVSGPSNAPSDVTTEPQPNAPIVTVAGTGYRLDLGYLNQIKLVAIGIVPLQIPCKIDGAMGLNLIDRAKLKLDPGKSLPKQVLANCG